MGCTESLALGNDKQQQQNRRARKPARQVSLAASTNVPPPPYTTTSTTTTNRNSLKHARQQQLDLRQQQLDLRQQLGSGILSEGEYDGEQDGTYPTVATLRGRRGRHWLQQHAPPAHSHVIAEPRSSPPTPATTTPLRAAASAMNTSTNLLHSADFLGFAKTELATMEGQQQLPSTPLNRLHRKNGAGGGGIQLAPPSSGTPDMMSNPLMPPPTTAATHHHSTASSPHQQQHASVSRGVSWSATDIGGHTAKQLYAGGGRTNSSPSSTNRSTPGPTNTTCTSPNNNSKPPLAPTPTQPHYHHHVAAAAVAGTIDLFMPTPTDINSDGIPTPVQHQHSQQQHNPLHPLHNSHRSTDTGLAAVMATSFNSVGSGARQHVAAMSKSGNREVGGIPLVPGLPRSVLQSTGTSSAVVSNTNNNNNNTNMSGSHSMRPSGLFSPVPSVGVQRKGRYERIRGWLDVIDDDTYHHTTKSTQQHQQQLPAVSVWSPS